MVTENYRRHVSMKLEKDWYMQANRMKVVEVDSGYAKLSMEVTRESLNGFGCVHGGALFGLADTTAGTAAFTDGRHYVTQSGNFQFTGNVSSGVIYARGDVIHRGRTVSIVEVKVFSEEGRLLGSGTYSMFAVNRPFWDTQE